MGFIVIVTILFLLLSGFMNYKISDKFEIDSVCILGALIFGCMWGILLAILVGRIPGMQTCEVETQTISKFADSEESIENYLTIDDAKYIFLVKTESGIKSESIEIENATVQYTKEPAYVEIYTYSYSGWKRFFVLGTETQEAIFYLPESNLK